MFLFCIFAGDLHKICGSLKDSLNNMRVGNLFKALSSTQIALGKIIFKRSSLPLAEGRDRGKTTVNSQKHSKKQSQQHVETIVFVNSFTLQSFRPYADKGYIQTDQTQEEGNNAQRGRCGMHRAVSRVVWAGGHDEEVRRDEVALLPRTRLARHRKGGDGDHAIAQTAGASGRTRATAALGGCLGGRPGKGSEWQSGELADWKQSAGAI